MKINGFRDWARFAQLTLQGSAIARLLTSGVSLREAMKRQFTGSGNTAGQQTDWTGRRTQIQESKRRLRQHRLAEHTFDGTRWRVYGNGIRAESHREPHPHLAKPPRGTPQPLPNPWPEHYHYRTYYSDGSVLTAQEARERALVFRCAL